MKPKSIAVITVIILVIFPLMLSCGQKQQENQASTGQAQQSTTTPGTTQQAAGQPVSEPTKPAPTAPAAFGGVEKRLTDTLLAMWQVKGHLTSIDQAAKMLGLTVDDSVRIDMMKKFEENLGISEKLTRYRPYTFILTNQEKLIAQYILNEEKQNRQFPAVAKVSSDLKVAETELKSRLKFLAAVGMLYDLGKPDENNGLGYSFGSSLSNFTYDMGLRFHVFYVNDQLPFNVGCAKEAFYLLATEFRNDKVKYETVDPLTLAPIQVDFDKGQIASITPPEAKFIEGGTCGANVLCTSAENAAAWIKTQPRMMQQQPPVYDIRERYSQITGEAAAQSGGK